MELFNKMVQEKKNKNKNRREISKNKKFFETFIPSLSIYLRSNLSPESTKLIVVDRNKIFLVCGYVLGEFQSA